MAKILPIIALLLTTIYFSIATAAMAMPTNPSATDWLQSADRGMRAARKAFQQAEELQRLQRAAVIIPIRCPIG